MAFVKLKFCLACKSKKLSTVLNLNKQPLANSFLKKKNQREKKYELKVNACLICNHLQLSIAVPPSKIYKNYDYVSGTTKTYKNYMKYFYNFCIRNLDKKIYNNILDIGCNDGSQLDVFKKNKFKTFGIDPAKNIYKVSSKKHRVICDFFTSKIANILNQKFDLIIMQNSFAHNPNPYQLLTNIKKLMHDKSTLIIQTSQADMCKNNEFDTVYHEHINFFNVNSMNVLTKRANLKLCNVEKNPIHGSSYLFVVKKFTNTTRIKKYLNNEKYLNIKYYRRWGKNCFKIIKNIRHNLKKINNIVGYGAAAKGNTFLNYSKIKLKYIIDDNKLKQNKFCPGSKIAVKSIDFLKKIKEDIFLIPLAWNFYSEIKYKVKKIRPDNNDKFIICFPKFKIE